MDKPVKCRTAGRHVRLAPGASVGWLAASPALGSLAVVLLVSCTMGVAWAAEDRAESGLRLAVGLVDGSRVIGSPSVKSVMVETPYVKMDLALDQIRRVALHKNRESASFDLVNGDKISGSVNLGRLKLATLFGEATIPVHIVKKIDVLNYGDPTVRFEIDQSGNIHDKLKDIRFKRPVANMGPYREQGPAWKTIRIDVRGKILADGKQHDYVVSADYCGGADCYHIKNFYLVVDGVRYRDMRPEPPEAGYYYLQGAENDPNLHRRTGFITSVPAISSCKSAELVFKLSDDVYPGGTGNTLDGTSVAIGVSETTRSDGSGSPVAPDMRIRMVPSGGKGRR